MIDSELITRKLKAISEYSTEIEDIFTSSTDEGILADSLRYHVVERLFQLIVDAIIDINIHIIRAKDIIPPDDFGGTFSILGKNGILDKDFALKIAPVVGLRNRVVHRYESLNRNQFIVDCRKNLADFKQYFVAIGNLIK